MATSEPLHNLKVQICENTLSTATIPASTHPLSSAHHTTVHSTAASLSSAVGGNEMFHHSPMTILATDNLSNTRCDIIA